MVYTCSCKMGIFSNVKRIQAGLITAGIKARGYIIMCKGKKNFLGFQSDH